MRKRLLSRRQSRCCARRYAAYLVALALVLVFGAFQQIETAVARATAHRNGTSLRTSSEREPVQTKPTLDPHTMSSLVPGVFAGYRRPVPHSPVLGIMWYPADEPFESVRLRLECGTELDAAGPLRYGWLQHNGRNYGVRHIEERGWHLNITHVAHTENLNLLQPDAQLSSEQQPLRSPEFSVRIQGTGQERRTVSFIVYWTAQHDEIDPERLQESAARGMEPPTLQHCSSPSITVASSNEVHLECGPDHDHRWRIVAVQGLPERSQWRQRRHRRRRQRASASRPVSAEILRELPDPGRIYYRKGRVNVGATTEVKSMVESWLRESYDHQRTRLREFYEKHEQLPDTAFRGADVFKDAAHARETPTAAPFPIITRIEDVDARARREVNADAELEPDAQHHSGIDDGLPSNLLVVQITVQTPFDIMITSSARMDASALSVLLEQADSRFRERFQQLFPRMHRGDFGSAQIAQARAALAGLLGGVSYFYGSFIAGENTQDRGSDQLRVSPPRALVSAVPSENKFPRGFLWDEGFHQLLIQRWDPELSLICLDSWLGFMQPSGWIPRELALGIEARNRFPRELASLLVQSEKVANPPTLMLPLYRHWQLLQDTFPVLELETFSSLCSQGGDGSLSDYAAMVLNQSVGDCKAVAQKTNTARLVTHLGFRKMKQYIRWLNATQKNHGWFGRHLTTLLAQDGGYPLTLASGFDDFPRSTDPSPYDAHVDLLSWILDGVRRLLVWRRTAGDLAEASAVSPPELGALEAVLQQRLYEVHWNADAGMFCDAGPRDNSSTSIVDTWRHHCHLGYPTLLPLSLGLLPVNATSTGALLKAVADPRQMYSDFGLRSLSAADPFYMRGDRYWTGPIWVPMNYLILAALREKYARMPGPYQKLAQQLYERTRNAMIQTILREHQRTGFFWEHYDPETGKGGGGHAFTGWTSLLVLLMEEDFRGVIVIDETGTVLKS